jgi:glycosyltransferase involved in cell wall biosynthesis
LARESFWLYQAREQVIAYGTAAPAGDPALQRHQFLDRFPVLAGKRVLLFLGRIHPKKGVDLLIEAFAVVASADPSLQLVIAGPDQVGWQEALERQAEALGIGDRISWPGMLRGDLKWGAFHAAELFCLPSHQENFGIAVAEALACGLPVAIGEPVNISGEVAEAKAGLVHADTSEGTREALQQWLALDDAERRAMGERGLALSAQRFEIGAAARDMRYLLVTLSDGSA